jgi:hypothetical protein
MGNISISTAAMIMGSTEEFIEGLCLDKLLYMYKDQTIDQDLVELYRAYRERYSEILLAEMHRFYTELEDNEE